MYHKDSTVQPRTQTPSGGSSSGPPKAGGLDYLGISSRGDLPQDRLYPYCPERVQALSEIGRTPKAFVTVYPAGLRVKRHGPGPLNPPPDPGNRGPIMGFSHDSHKRLMRLLMMVDWDAHPGYFTTLTYHHHYRLDDWGQWKRDLKTWLARLHRAWGHRLLGGFWRLEFQDRMAPHYHLTLFWSGQSPPRRETFQKWVAKSWMEVAEPGNELNRKVGTDVRRVRNTKGWGVGKLISYLSKYLGKLESHVVIDPDTGELVGTGRIWGFWGDVPFTTVATMELDGEQWTAFCKAINEEGEATGSWYYRSISPLWEGFSLWGPGLLLLEKLTEHIPDIRWTPRHGLGEAVG